MQPPIIPTIGYGAPAGQVNRLAQQIALSQRSGLPTNPAGVPMAARGPPMDAQPQGHAPPPANEPRPPPSKPENDIPHYKPIPMGYGRLIQRFCVTSEFHRLVAALWMKEFRKPPDESIVAALAMACHTRMRYATQQCVTWAKRRCCENMSAPRCYVDVPVARFAVLKAEQEIIARQAKIASSAPETISPSLDRLRNEAVAGVAAQVGSNERDEILQTAKDIEEPEVAVGTDCGSLLSEVPQKEKNRAVTLEDVVAFVESDAYLAQMPMFAFSVQVRKQKRAKE